MAAGLPKLNILLYRDSRQDATRRMPSSTSTSPHELLAFDSDAVCSPPCSGSGGVMIAPVGSHNSRRLTRAGDFGVRERLSHLQKAGGRNEDAFTGLFREARAGRTAAGWAWATPVTRGVSAGRNPRPRSTIALRRLVRAWQPAWAPRPWRLALPLALGLPWLG